jgi:CO/xanthine dehydrogenase FAD-binding subunit
VLTRLAELGDDAKLLAGGQSLVPAMNLRLARPRVLIDLGRVRGLDGIHAADGTVTLGALVRQRAAEGAEAVHRRVPLLAQALPFIGHPAIRNRGTIGGNVANASPAADTPPALLVYDAELELVSAGGSRRVPYDRFHLAYKKMDLRPGELIARLRLPRKWHAWSQTYRKVGTRRAQAISKVCLAAAARVENGVVADVRLAVGSVAPTVVRGARAERELRRRRLTPEIARRAADRLVQDISPIDDMRSTARYRATVSRNLLLEFLEPLIERH